MDLRSRFLSWNHNFVASSVSPWGVATLLSWWKSHIHRASRLIFFSRRLPSAAKKHMLVDRWAGHPQVQCSLSLLPYSFLLLLLLFCRSIYIYSLINISSFCFFDRLGHASNFCFLLLSASSGEMCTQRQRGFQSRLHPPVLVQTSNWRPFSSTCCQFSQQPGD